MVCRVERTTAFKCRAPSLPGSMYVLIAEANFCRDACSAGDLERDDRVLSRVAGTCTT